MDKVLPVHKQHFFNIKVVELPDRVTKWPTRIRVKMMSGKLLMERKHFIRHCETKSVTDRLVHEGHLTSYHANGTIKERRQDGRLPNTKTFYDVAEWRRINYNNL